MDDAINRVLSYIFILKGILSKNGKTPNKSKNYKDIIQISSFGPSRNYREYFRLRNRHKLMKLVNNNKYNVSQQVKYIFQNFLMLPSIENIKPDTKIPE